MLLEGRNYEQVDLIGYKIYPLDQTFDNDEFETVWQKMLDAGTIIIGTPRAIASHEFVRYNTVQIDTKIGEAMPATIERQRKTSRLDLRMESERKAAYEEAARLKGQSLSRWSLASLDASAARDIAEARALRLTSEQFDQFCNLLDQPMPKEFRELLEWEPEWA